MTRLLNFSYKVFRKTLKLKKNVKRLKTERYWSKFLLVFAFKDNIVQNKFFRKIKKSSKVKEAEKL